MPPVPPAVVGPGLAKSGCADGACSPVPSLAGYFDLRPPPPKGGVCGRLVPPFRGARSLHDLNVALALAGRSGRGPPQRALSAAASRLEWRAALTRSALTPPTFDFPHPPPFLRCNPPVSPARHARRPPSPARSRWPPSPLGQRVRAGSYSRNHRNRAQKCLNRVPVCGILDAKGVKV